MNKFYLPRLEEIVITDYGLYKCPLKITFNSKLNVIFGTNGTGKSTLLMLILFSIIGPYRGGIKTKTRNEQRKDNRPLYDEDFFINRVIQFEDMAQVTSKFYINGDKYEVTHSLNDCSLRKVIINDEEIKGKVVTYKTYESKYSKTREKGEHNAEELKGYLIYEYQERIKESTDLPGGVNTLINMLLDVMFFDEGRKFTFWSADLQETIIGKYIVDKDFYEEYCEKKLETKALESKYKKARDEALLAYNTSKEEENVMKKEVEAKLVNNFRDFSNIFCRYAKSFFGGNHVVKLSLPFITDESIDETMIRFSLDGKERTESFMLSESQRIFTDLAFRFAILTSFHEQSFFMCETPDSTLDLLHETNAVNTFKEYINMGNMLILTANARKSNLVSELYNSYDEKDKNVIDLTYRQPSVMNT